MSPLSSCAIEQVASVDVNGVYFDSEFGVLSWGGA
jgi:hypothetical protein